MPESHEQDSQALLEARRVSKVYPDGTVALRDVDLSLRPGEVLGLLGENGAGKTTLTKILSGLLPPTAGTVLSRKGPVHFRSPREALAFGIGMVHQHFALVDTFTAVQNVALGLEEVPLGELRQRLSSLMGETGLRVPLDTAVERLSVGQRQRVEILKVLARQVSILILDEPTSVLTPAEVDELFSFLRRLREQGRAVVFITHKLKEVLALADRIVVMRRGETVGEVSAGESSPRELARLMVGEEIDIVGRRSLELSTAEVPEQAAAVEAERAQVPALEAEALDVVGEDGEDAVRELSFSLFPGEIFGVAGVEGNGQAELVEAVCGLRSPRKGSIRLGGREVGGRSATEVYRLGLAHIPADRWKHGLVLPMSVAENGILGLQRTPQFRGRAWVLRRRRMMEHARSLMERFQVQALGVTAPVGSLSGGNQQKLIAGRELSKDPTVVVAAQPTRGLDIGAAQAIRDLLLSIRSQGKAVLLVSADLDEVLALSDRVGFMYEGRFTAVARPGELSREEIGMYMGGVERCVPLHLAFSPCGSPLPFVPWPTRCWPRCWGWRWGR